MRHFRHLLFCAAWCAAAFAQTQSIAVISHRGEHLKHPENTIAAFQAAADAGATFFECDVRTTRDGKLVLMHDESVDRTTDGHGKVADLTFDEIRALKPAVPTFDEALAFARGRIGVYIDSKVVTAQQIVDAVSRHDMAAHVVVYGSPKLLADLPGTLRIMPEARSARRLTELLETLHPPVVAFDAADFKSDIIALARAARAGIYVDRLGPADNEQSWQDALDKGATGIQTDHPAELVQYLRRRGYTVAK